MTIIESSTGPVERFRPPPCTGLTGSDRGGETVELVLLTPVLLGVPRPDGVVGPDRRGRRAGGGAARDAARAASLKRTTGLAADVAHRAAETISRVSASPAGTCK